MKSFKEMSDYQLCYHKTNSGATEELWNRYKNLVFKYSHTFYNQIRRNIPLEDIIQDFNVLFFTAITKIDLKRVKSKEKFQIIIFIPYFFQAYQKGMFRHYRYETNPCLELNSLYEEGESEKVDNMNIQINSMHYEKNTENLFIESLKKVLEPIEYEIIYKFYICKIKKGIIAKELKISPPLFTSKMNKILKKLREILAPERDLLLA